MSCVRRDNQSEVRAPSGVTLGDLMNCFLVEGLRCDMSRVPPGTSLRGDVEQNRGL